jgi:hypothetical protein
MDDLPRQEIGQQPLPGTDRAEAKLVLHAITTHNFSQRVTIARRAVNQGHFRYHDIVLTRAQVLELIDLLIDRVDTLTDDIPKGPR